MFVNRCRHASSEYAFMDGREEYFLPIFPNANVNNSHRISLALFALGVIIFFGERYVFGYVAMLVSMLAPSESGTYQFVLQSYMYIYVVSAIMIIAGAAVFYRGQKQVSNLEPPANSQT